MDYSEINNEWMRIYNNIKEGGMCEENYLKIAEDFNQMVFLPTPIILEMLAHLVVYKGKHIYVNEIRNYLKENSYELFIKYGMNFKDKRGCTEVFGIEEENVIVPSFKEEIVEIQNKSKEYNNKKKKRQPDREAKRNAKNTAIEKQRQKAEYRKEKEAKNKELQNLIRKQDL